MDFETRYFTINAESLPAMEISDEYNFSIKKGPKTFADLPLPSSKITAQNYWQSVDMMAVITNEQTFVDTKSQALSLNGIRYGFSDADSAAGKPLTNFVYKEANGLDMFDPCPPFGICSRCAPFRVSRGY
jgi:hypothetical protein